MLVTRPERQADGMVARLRELGAEPIAFPTIRIEDPSDGSRALRAATREVASFDWIVLTSVNGVERFWAVLEEQEGGAREAAAAVAEIRFGCIGPRTAAALEERGVRVEIVPDRYVAEGLAEALPLAEMRGRSVLMPRAAGSRAVLRERLEAAGAQVREVEAYRAVADAPEAARVRVRVDRGEIDVLTFTSSSTVERYVEAIGARTGGALVAAIGPITADTALELGLEADIVAREHTIAGLIDALIEYRTYSSTREQQ